MKLQYILITFFLLSISVLQSKAQHLSSAPQVPTTSRFMPFFDTNGWVSMRNGLNEGSELYSNIGRKIASMPDYLQDCDYVQPYSTLSYEVFFHAERDIEVYLAVDGRCTGTELPKWFESWERKEDKIIADDGHEYQIFKSNFQAGYFVNIPRTNTKGFDNYITIIRPKEAFVMETLNAIPAPSREKPLLPQRQYKWYVNDVFNTIQKLPQEYSILYNAVVKLVENPDFIHPKYISESSYKDKYVTIVKQNKKKTPAIVRRTFEIPLENKFILEAKVRAPQNNSQCAIPALSASNGVELLSLLFDSDGYISSSNGKIMPYSSNEWYSVKLCVDPQLGKYDVWINDLRKVHGATCAKGEVAFVDFSVISTGTELSLDNFMVYDDTEVFAVNDNFSHIATGHQPSKEWQISNPSSIVVEYPFADSKSLRVTSVKTPVSVLRQIAPMQGSITVETTVRPTESGWISLPITDSNGRTAVKVAFFRNNLYACNGDNWERLLCQASDWAYYPTNNWYRIKVVLDTYTRRYNLYVDGALRASDLAFAEEVVDISAVGFCLEEANTCYIKDLCIYDDRSLARGMLPIGNVLDVRLSPYNAKGDGVSNDTQAIQRAIEDANMTGGTVYLHDGVFFTHGLILGSDMNFFIDESARLLGSQERSHYRFVEPGNGLNAHKQLGRGLLYGEGLSNVRIEGGGVIDGNGTYGFHQNDPPMNRREELARPDIIYIARSRDVSIVNLDLVGSAFWTLVPLEVTNCLIRNVNLNSMNTPNRDGIDPVDCHNVTIENCCVMAGDDGICFKSSDITGAYDSDVRNVIIQSLSNGIKFGTDSYFAYKRFNISDVIIKNTTKSAIAIESPDGADIADLRFERIDINDTDNPIIVLVGDRKRQPWDKPGERIGSVDGILFKDIVFRNPKTYPYTFDRNICEVFVMGHDSGAHRVKNVHFENVYLELPGGYTHVPKTPEGLKNRYPEHYSMGESPASAYYIRYAENVTFRNCQTIFLKPDVRPEILFKDYYSSDNTKEN